MLSSQVVEVNFSEMMATIEVCNNLPAPPSDTEGQSSSQSEEEGAGGLARVNIMTLTRGILPGTLWCGVNDIAPDFSSLGVDRELDRCCRAHDHCPVKVGGDCRQVRPWLEFSSKKYFYHAFGSC